MTDYCTNNTEYIDSACRKNAELALSSLEAHTRILNPELQVLYLIQAEWLKVENRQLISTLARFRSSTTVYCIRAAEIFKTSLDYILRFMNYHE
jgi:hypothetical protein